MSLLRAEEIFIPIFADD